MPLLRKIAKKLFSSLRNKRERERDRSQQGGPCRHIEMKKVCSFAKAFDLFWG